MHIKVTTPDEFRVPVVLSSSGKRIRQGIVHGTVCGYTYWKCRCDLCKATSSLVNRLYYSKRYHHYSDVLDERSQRCLLSSRTSDNAKGRIGFDLTLEYVKSMLSQPCSYCGSSGPEIMSLDRIDNSLAHSVGNVVTSCYRCNMFRRNMPYDAWLIVSKAVKVAEERGLLDGWSIGPRTKRTKQQGSVRGVFYKRDLAADRYSLNPKLCLRCNNPIPFTSRRNMFCGRSCAAIVSNGLNENSSSILMPVSHGKSNGYNHHKCRCELCIAWKKQQAKIYRERLTMRKENTFATVAEN